MSHHIPLLINLNSPLLAKQHHIMNLFIVALKSQCAAFSFLSLSLSLFFRFRFLFSVSFHLHSLTLHLEEQIDLPFTPTHSQFHNSSFFSFSESDKNKSNYLQKWKMVRFKCLVSTGFIRVGSKWKKHAHFLCINMKNG